MRVSVVRRWVSIVSGVALAVFLLATAKLGSLERGAPHHADVVLEGGIPVTLYLPGDGSGGPGFQRPLPPGERPPALVLAHGFAGDRRSVSSAARRLAASGYAVLAPDLRGHGENRNPHTPSRTRSDHFFSDLATAVDFLRASPYVDGSRIAVAGHSMGAGAALDYGTRDSGIDAVVLVSGGWSLNGPYPPPNALFLYAEGDPKRIRERCDRLAARIAGRAGVERARTYGDLAIGTGVRVVEVAGANHASILWTDAAVGEIVNWLDAVFGIERSKGPLPDDPRLRLVAVMGLCILLLMPGLGVLVGRLVPAAAELPASGRGAGLAALLIALVVTMPLLAVGSPLAIVPLEAVDMVVSHLALAGVSLLVWFALRDGPGPASIASRPLPALVASGVALLALVALLHPTSVVLHRTALTPERVLAFVTTTLALLPFSLSLQLSLRRGPPLTATAFAAAGRVLVVLVLVLGIRVGVLGGVLAFVLGPLVPVFVLVEIVAAAVYATSRNLLTIALVDASWLALVLAASMPIRW
jgi:dienelactone hydrolase